MSNPTDSNLRFLFLANDKYPPFRVDVDVLFAKEFHRRGHQIDWLMQAEEDQPTPATLNWQGWKVYLGATDNGPSFINRLRKHMRVVLNDFRIFGALRQDQYQFVQVKDRFIGAIIGLIAARRAKLPFFFWLSYPFPEASLYEASTGTARYPFLYRIRGWFWHLMLYRLIAPFCDHIFVQSAQMKLDMQSAGVAAERMTPVLMGFEPVQLDDSVVEDSNQMVYLGTLLQTRKLDFLVRVLARVKETNPKARLVMIGPEELPGDQELLLAEAKRLGVEDSLVLTGRMDRSDAFKIVRESAVCLSPFYPTPILNSTSPTKLVEYFSQKKAVVANDHPEQRAVVEESGSGHCVAYDETAFAKAAIDLLNNPGKRQQFGQTGYDYAIKNRTYNMIATQLENHYRTLLKIHHPIPRSTSRGGNLCKN